MSSTDVHQQGNGVLCGSRAPPPTPNAGNNGSAINVDNDAFSAFLEKSLGISSLVLPESLVRTSAEEIELPVIDLLSERDDLVRSLMKSASEYGCFQVINHGVSSDLVERAQKECNQLFELPLEKKEAASRSLESLFGFDESDTTASVRQESFWLQRDANQIEDFIRNIWPEGCVNLSCALSDYSSALQRVASQMMELLFEGLGLEASSFAADMNGSSNASVLHISNQKGSPKSLSGRLKHSHPYILGLQYHNVSYDCHVYVDRSWVVASPQLGSLMVTVGDIMKVWSNGQYKNVIGRPVAISDKTCTSMALLYSPSMESIICPKLEFLNSDKHSQYTSFAFKDYASRLRKQRFLFKDPLERFRI
eukprot:Gb_22744 [translate_table: standard]